MLCTSAADILDLTRHSNPGKSAIQASMIHNFLQTCTVWVYRWVGLLLGVPAPPVALRKE
jgi:hypothetical protein